MYGPLLPVLPTYLQQSFVSIMHSNYIRKAFLCSLATMESNYKTTQSVLILSFYACFSYVYTGPYVYTGYCLQSPWHETVDLIYC